ncbi:MAG: DUF4177 domain-containing protein [Dermatophilaceae bacterium]
MSGEKLQKVLNEQASQGWQLKATTGQNRTRWGGGRAGDVERGRAEHDVINSSPGHHCAGPSGRWAAPCARVP